MVGQAVREAARQRRGRGPATPLFRVWHEAGPDRIVGQIPIFAQAPLPAGRQGGLAAGAP